MVVVGGLLVTRLPFFQVKYVDVHNSPSTSVTKLAQTLVGSSIFSNRINVVTRQVLEQHGELESFTCTRGLPATIRCEAESREAQFLWKSAGKTYLLDRTGYIFAEAASELLPAIEDRANQSVTVGQAVTSEETITTYKQLITDLQQQGMTITQLYITESFYQFGVIISARVNKPFPSNPISVLFTTSYPVTAQSTVLNKVLDERATQIKERVDLRVPGNVYFY